MIVRTDLTHLQGNLGNNAHGGAILTQIDIALFVAAQRHCALEHGPAVTLDINTQFIGAGQIGRPLHADVEILRETGRLLFLRGLMVPRDTRVAALSGAIRKTTRPRA